MCYWCCSDLHGYYSVYEQINKFIGPKDKVFFLGDAVDRGPESFKLMDAIRNNPQWTYIKGNHEDMLQEALQEKAEHLDSPCLNLAYYQCIRNGAEAAGKSAYKEILEKEKLNDYIEFLDQLPVHVSIASDNELTITLSHAGYTPLANREAAKYTNREKLIWDRDHVTHDINQRDFELPIISIHGHTPTWHMINSYHVEGTKYGDETFPLLYYGNGKIDIDAGIFTSGIAYLVNLSTLTLENLEFETFHATEELAYGET